ncbi:MAG: hypothetical protein EOO37_04435 [Cytophagaceae bacterium]|nr:MAG: hypothetical protein EOO37_04435 [Cytophagaceae bacterium]
MKKYALPLLPVLLLLACGKANGQANPKLADKQKREREAVYLKESLALIKQLEGKALTANFLLLDKPASLSSESESCLKDVLTDTISYSKAELKTIKNYTQPVIASWAGMLPEIRILKSDTVQSIFKDRHRNWDYFYKNIGQSFNAFSSPIFFRNYTYCLFYSANYCGGLCGGGSLRLYKKQKGVWVVVKSYCEWVS